MKVNYYTIRDLVAEECGPVFPAKNDAVAMRQFDLSLQNCAKKSDFELWFLYEFDTETAKLDLSKDAYKVAVVEVAEDVDNEN